jgi:hypothetical protein
MAINEYFRSNLFGSGEQKLVEDLLIESIKIYGMDCEFVPYTLHGKDGLFGEDTLLRYEKAYPLECYIENVQGFEGRNDFLTKFGLQIEEQGSLLVSIRRFRQSSSYKYYRPREKDLFYFPLTDSLYEITFVEHEKIFHQVGGLQVYSMRIDLMNYSNQQIRTGVGYIDRFEDEHAHAIQFQVAIGTGRYVVGEMAYQGANLAAATASAKVIWYDRDKKILKVKDVNGFFDPTQTIKGNTSGVEYTIAVFNEKDLPNSPIADNKQVKVESATVINWSEKNPFGEPT